MHVKPQIAQLDEFALRGTTGLIRQNCKWGAQNKTVRIVADSADRCSPRCKLFVAIGQPQWNNSQISKAPMMAPMMPPIKTAYCAFFGVARISPFRSLCITRLPYDISSVGIE